MSEILLVSIAAKATAVLGAAWVVARAMAGCSAASRHLVWTLAVVAVLALPVVQMAGPPWSLPLLPGSDLLYSATQPLDMPRVMGSDPMHGATHPSGAVAAHAPSPRTISWPTTLVAVWLAGVGAAMLWLVTGLAWAGRVRWRALDVSEPEWTATLGETADALGVRGAVALKMSPDTSVPVACGIWRPAILLPADAGEWTPDRRRVVLLHELAHVARRDCLVQVVAQLGRSVYWFNPLAHLAVAELRREQERACDDLVLAAGTDASSYADHLLEIARAFHAGRAPAWATVAMARPSQLEGRVLAILDERRNRRPPARWTRAAVGAMVATLMLPLGLVQLTAAAQPAPEADAPEILPSAATTALAVLPEDFLDFDWYGPIPRPLSQAQAQTQTPAPPAPPAPLREPDGAVSDETRRRVADSLMTALGDEDADVREQALNGLARMRDPRAIPGLTQAMRDASADVRLVQFSTPDAVSAITGALQDQDADVRARAVRAVTSMVGRGILDAAEYVDVFIGLLRDAEPGVRAQAAAALGAIADPRAIDPLTAALTDPEPEVRERAARALGQIARGPRRQGLPDLAGLQNLPDVTIDTEAIREAVAQAQQAAEQEIDGVRRLQERLRLQVRPQP